jgi:hypothetical protein
MSARDMALEHAAQQPRFLTSHESADQQLMISNSLLGDTVTVTCMGKKLLPPLACRAVQPFNASLRGVFSSVLIF